MMSTYQIGQVPKPQSTDQARRRGVGGLESRQKRGDDWPGRRRRVVTEVWRPWWSQSCLKKGPSTVIPGALTPV